MPWEMAPWRSLCPAAVRGDDHTSAVFCCHIKNSSKSCYWKTEIAGLGTCPLRLLSSSTSFVSYHPTGQNCSALQTFPSSPLAKVGSARSWRARSCRRGCRGGAGAPRDLGRSGSLGRGSTGQHPGQRGSELRMWTCASWKAPGKQHLEVREWQKTDRFFRVKFSEKMTASFAERKLCSFDN